MEKTYLQIPIFPLYDVVSIISIKLTDDDAEFLKSGYTLAERKHIHEALVWAKDNPDFEFESIMDRAPIVGKLPFSNEEIYAYLMRFKTFMEESKSLLIEESSPKY
ncbi:hypothetical protein [Flavobacterium lindanitolerans]|uniref:Uncharacterized protein n=1 Tax=Flavobacterium lindanitolerans TaxID=428988 RepID=A0A497UIV0_9FLAO|nr:hypothetical protein [Flavobacterium lindanitolerans]PKW20879.1 hypothetical protein B0G92_2158 [Flavobacterium lindanitolerans]RLJ30482.1 hypothetical protein CLV50_1892 [Flavobacterium lindanitolerans]THD32145.1 MAG: hypothetical protein DI588_08580 [Flavobacterium johnsoniae]